MRNLLIILAIVVAGCSVQPVIKQATIVGVKDITINLKPVKLVQAVDERGDTITRVLMPVQSVKPGSTLYYVKDK